MDLHNKQHDDELLDRLLKEYLLEKEGDPAVQQAREMLAQEVFEEETVLEPGAAREKTLENLTTGKKGFGFDLGFNGTVAAGIIIILLLLSALSLLIPSEKIPEPATNKIESPKPESPKKEITASTSTASTEPPAQPVADVSKASTAKQRTVAEPDLEPPMTPDEQNDAPVNFQWLKDKLSVVNDQQPKDRLYLRTDKSLYKTGERVWLAVYVRDATTLQKSKMSEVVYVHLINPENQVQKSIRLIVRDGIASGDFFLEDRYPGGIYKLKTYTNWQKNDQSAKFFEKEIQVQQLINSDISLKLDFEKEEFTKDEKIKATVNFTNAKGEPLRDFTFQCVVTLADEKKLEFEKTTNESGNAFLEFRFPDKEDVHKGFLNFYFEYKGNKEFLSEEIPVQEPAVRLELFPEGGDLVAGILSKVAFQAVDQTGRPVAVKGDVKDGSGDQVVSFASNEEGRGVFEFTPEAGEKYTAWVRNSDAAVSIPLPWAKATGFVLQVDHINYENVELTVKASSNAQVLLSAIQRGKLCYTNSHTVNIGENKIKIPVTNLPMGILQITLFDKQGIPQAERLAFINYKTLDIDLTSDQNTVGVHQKVSLHAATKNEFGKVQPAHLSLSIVNQHLVSDNSGPGIFSGLFLTSELNDGALNYDCYFHGNKQCGEEELDLLLMTKGWRKFSWEEISAPTRSVAYAGEQTKVAGRVLDPVYSRPMEGVEISIDGIGNTTTDAKGHFSFTNLNLENKVEMLLAFGREKMTYQLSEYDDQMEIIFYGDGKKIYQPEEKGVRHPLVKALKRSSSETAILLGKVVDSRYEPLPGAVIKLLKNGELFKTTTSDINGFYQIETADAGIFDVIVSHSNFKEHKYGGHQIEKGKALLLDVLLSDEKTSADAERKSTALASLNGNYPIRVPALKATELSLEKGVDFNQVLDGFSETFNLDETGNLYLKAFKDQNNVYLDGLNLGYNNPVSISKTQIEQISIYNEEESSVKQDGETTNCIIEIKTTTNDTETTAGSKEVFISRYYRAKEFPRIYYNTGKKEPVGNDFRTTLYWNPDLKTDANGKTTVDFYSSDVPGTYKVIVEAITDDGKVGYGELEFEVKE